MGINATNIKNIERKIREYNENLTLFEQQFVIIPYLASGYIDYSNFGQVDGQYQINNFETYKRVWTGNDSFIITWKDSVELVNDDEGKTIERNYKIGDYLLGWLENNSSTNDIATDQSFNYYKSQSSEQALTFRINASKFSLDTNYEFMFYKVPEYSKDVLYRVESIDREYVGKDLMCYVLRLKALNQDLANTGQAKQQNVMPNSPGQGYYAPLIVSNYQPQRTDVWGVHFVKIDNRYITYDKNKILDNPVKKVVVKAFGLCIFSNIAIWGRRAAYGADFRSFEAPRWIFPIAITNASTQTIYRVQSSESNYYWLSNTQPTIIFNSETFTALKNFFKTDALWTGQGFLGVDIDTAQKTNPSTETTSYTYQLYGDNVLEKGTVVNKPWTITIPNKTYRTDTIYGCEQQYSIGGTKRIHDAMFDAFWTQKNMVALPITARNTMSFGWTLGASYAAAVARNFLTSTLLMLIGITGTIINKVLKPDFQGFSGMMPAALFDFMKEETTGIYGKTGNNQIKLSYFENYDQENDINKFFNTQTINTSFEAELTDKISSPRLRTSIAQTTCIGQTTFADGSNVCTDGTAFLLNGDATLIELDSGEKDIGFIVDAFNIQAIFMGDYSIEFLDKDGTVIWSGIYQSQGKWTGSVREINTWINTSIYGRENMFVSQPLPWPKEIPPLHLIGYQKPELINLNYGAEEIGTKLGLYYGEYQANDDNFLTQATWRDVIEKEKPISYLPYEGLNLTWTYNSDNEQTYHCIAEAHKKVQEYTTRVVIKTNWVLDVDAFLNQYEKISLTFDEKAFLPEDTPYVQTTVEATLSKEFDLTTTTDCKKGGYQNSTYAETIRGEYGMPYAFAFFNKIIVDRNIHCKLVQEGTNIILEMKVRLGGLTLSHIAHKYDGVGWPPHFWIVDTWLSAKPSNIWDLWGFGKPGGWRWYWPYVGNYLRNITITPYEIPEPPTDTDEQ